ncbi:hypothetical protein ES332_D03G113800v1 [Gossypium tomentosum]|uniref:USP domain-containing protein n=1 Tax=Gossypium tomentosum TaxID=34277 RepID=A0A5D2LLJ2_GOSTO|nr:hypothetical protein ES332_D03G113800v1 [Gossypium tomentosum]TYH80178.1 hypothetical protein ES332_D03G113800v1 [Gossypium tomentosum]
MASYQRKRRFANQTRPTSGHYVCYIRSSPNMWHKMNDSRVTCVEEEAVLSQEAYILLYAK